MRDARRYVYKLEKANPDRTQYLTEKWQALDEVTNPQDRGVWTANHAKAERVARSFDQLGLLVREGIIPINIIARFYASPALRCWHNLRPYLEAERDRRNQKGHMWEWEHLVADVLIPELRRNKGVWEGVSKHDDLEGYCNKVEHELKTMYRDTDYKPGTHLWEIGPWYDCRKW